MALGARQLMSDRFFSEIVDLADRRAALLKSAGESLRRLLGEIGSPASGVLAALNEPPSSYNVSVELAIHQLRRQIVIAGQPDWARQLTELNYASRAIRAASDIAQQLVTTQIR